MKQGYSLARRHLPLIRLAAGLLVVLASGCAALGNEARLEAGFREMYGLDFEASDRHFREYTEMNSSDPLGHAGQASCLLFMELHRLGILEAEFFVHEKEFLRQDASAPDPGRRSRLLEQTNTASSIAEKALVKDPSDQRALFALALVNGVLADYTALVERRYWASLKFGRAGDNWARKLLEVNPEFYDAYLWTGTTHYIIGSLPMPARWLARLAGVRGNKRRGYQELGLAAEKGKYLAPYAKVLLAIAYLREERPSEARAIVSELAKEFPTNSLFKAQAERLAMHSR